MANVMLPQHVVTVSDLKRVRREIEALDEFLHAAGLRQGGKPTKLPTTSQMLDSLVTDSKLNMLKQSDRDRLKKYVVLLIAKAPVLHFSFASEPSGVFLNKLVVWIRANIHPQAVISVGLQPSITAGCIVRTANKQFDLSMRQSFEDQHNLLIEAIRAEETVA